MRAHACLAAALLLAGAGGGCLGSDRELFYVFVAGSLGPVFSRAFEPAFEEAHPGLDVVVEAQGSRETAKKVTELGREADFVGVADVDVIESLMVPGHAAFAARFASNAMVLAYTGASEGRDDIREITGDPADGPWYDVLAENRRVIVGRSDPNTDPAGYRTLFLWRLADAHYGADVYARLKERFPSPTADTESTMTAALLVGDLDYAFTYRSLAVDAGLRYVDLPDEIDLSSASHAEAYANVSERLADGTTVTGSPILYGFTVPANAPHPALAVEFAALVAGPAGMEALREAGLLAPPPGHGRPFVPVEQWDAVPPALQAALELA